MDDEMSQVFAFPDGSASFVNGFEAGLLWQEMDGDGKTVIERGINSGFPIHAENIEVVRRMATARGFQVETGVEADGWLPVRLTWIGTGKTKPKLEVVSRG